MRSMKKMLTMGILAASSMPTVGCTDFIVEGITGGINGGLESAFEALILTPAEQAIADAFPEDSE